MRSSFIELKTLKKAVFKGSRSAIPERALFCCRGLETIVLPEDLTSIESEAFDSCEGIKTLSIPSGVKAIKYDALANCKSLKTLTILNPECTFEGNDKISDYLTIYGYENSTAQKYAEENNYKFALLEEAPVIAESPVPTPVTSPDPSPVPTPVSSPDPSPVPTSSPTPTAEPKVEVIPVEDADMNDDSVITMADYVTLIKRILTANVEYDAAFDINKDNKIDAADVITLRKVFLGTVVCE
ncbi:MAG: leucine-rich repeat protein, partial [Oscillospiraceae bacterium]|nr:leucine-rich repeat protein [Oscillospiraceae bacterium]